jgi:hypothetical protein
MIMVARLPSVTPEVRDAFLRIWIEHKMLSLTVGNRRVMANALRVLLPGDYTGPPLTLYRGASGSERRRHIYGFSWTTDVTIAQEFAEHWVQPVPGPWKNDGVILQTEAPPEAILLVRKRGQIEAYEDGKWVEYYDEGEVVVDPFRLGKVELVERLFSSPSV